MLYTTTIYHKIYMTCLSILHGIALSDGESGELNLNTEKNLYIMTTNRPNIVKTTLYISKTTYIRRFNLFLG